MAFSTFTTQLTNRSELFRSALLNTLLILSCALFCTFFYTAAHADGNSENTIDSAPLAPPALGEQTKGVPAVSETAVTSETQNDQTTEQKLTPFGDATVTEHKRENGQVYLIEIENSLGGKQYLYENDSDGQIGSSIEDNDSIKDIPKWKIGSW